MRELTLGDAFWRDAIAALREPGDDGVAGRLEGAWPEYAALLRELARSGSGDSCLVGGRPATAGKNPRLFLLLTAAALAREGVETLYLDLNGDLRWLEMLTGEDLKEGLVDHLQYDVPLDRCLRATPLPGLTVLSGGAHFLAGSPLEDAPAFRAVLKTLRSGFEAVVAAFPHPFDVAESAGVTTLCDAWIAIEEGEVQADLRGSERAVVQLSGDPQAAWDLARLSSAFLGPLPAVLASGGGSGTDRPARRERSPGLGTATPTAVGASWSRAADPESDGDRDPWRMERAPRRDGAVDEDRDREDRDGGDRDGDDRHRGDGSDRNGDADGTEGGIEDRRVPEPGKAREAAPFAAGGFGDLDRDPRGTDDRQDEPYGPAPFEDEEEVAFLRAFEGVAAARERVARDEDPAGGVRVADGEPPRERRGEEREWERRERTGPPSGGAAGRTAVVTATVGAAAVVALLLVGFFTGLFDPLWAGSGDEPEWGIDVGEAEADGGDGTMVALDGAGGTGTTGEAPSEDATPDAAATENVPVAIPGEPAPFSLHVGSYQSPESGGRVVRRLEDVGQTAFLASVDLGERGRWYRVYAGAFADSASARRTLESILGRDLVEEGAVRRTPWAFRLGVHETREAAVLAVEGHAAEGISAYVVGDGPSTVWAGAYRSEDEAATMAAALEEAGVEATLVERERPVTAGPAP